jgi:hypothetical protein
MISFAHQMARDTLIWGSRATRAYERMGFVVSVRRRDGIDVGEERYEFLRLDEL